MSQRAQINMLYVGVAGGGGLLLMALLSFFGVQLNWGTAVVAAFFSVCSAIVSGAHALDWAEKQAAKRVPPPPMGSGEATLSRLVEKAEFRNTLLDVVGVFGAEVAGLTPAAKNVIRRRCLGSPPSEGELAQFTAARTAIAN